jgi:hypothetical protein
MAIAHCLDFQPALRAAHAIELHYHDGPILAPRQIPKLALPDLLDLPAASTTPETGQNLERLIESHWPNQWPAY